MRCNRIEQMLYCNIKWIGTPNFTSRGAGQAGRAALILWSIDRQLRMAFNLAPLRLLASIFVYSSANICM